MRPNIRKRKKRLSILITAGPTREKIDPVRFISNYSTGTFGYEIARAARRRGAHVILVSGPTHLDAPQGVKLVKVESALDMLNAVKKEAVKADCIIMAAAVSDWRPARLSKSKLKKGRAGAILNLVKNPDILREVSGKPGRISVGFALETEDLARNALRKLKQKKLDIIVGNRLSPETSVFGDTIFDILIIDKYGKSQRFKRESKKALAKIILDKIFTFNI